jgi:D-alanyl-D-alanine carboxypeptidase
MDSGALAVDTIFFGECILMAKLAWTCLLGVLMLTSVQPTYAERGNPSVEFEGQTIDAMIAAFMKEHRIPGMTLAIVQAPYITRVVGYGVSDVEEGLLASPKTLWNVGQMTQAYTAVAIMQLVEAEKMTLDDPVGKHVSELPAVWQPITVRQLMAHVSGLPDYTKQASFNPAQDYKPGEVMALVKNVPLAFQSGTQVANSATDFFLLGLVVEKVSGVSYQAFVTMNQIERLGLKNTLFASALPDVKQEAVEKNDFKHKEFLSDPSYINPTEKATGYAEKDGKLVPVKRNSQSAWYADAAVLASAEDISLWDIGLAGNLLVSKKENRDFLYSAVKLNDGTVVPAHCGWRFPGHKGLMDIEGQVPGFSCYLSRFTDKAELVCVTLCANKEGVDLTALARLIAGAFNRKLGPPVGPKVMTCLESCYPVQTAVNRLEALLKSKGVDIAARIDHAAAAKKKGLELRPTEVLVFGNPAVGTHLMLSRPSIALDLPLRVVVWQEPDGTVWLGYHDVADLVQRYGIADRADVVAVMQAGLAAALRHATAPY